MKDKQAEVLISEYLNVTDVSSTSARWTKKWAQLVGDDLYVYSSSKNAQHYVTVNVKGLDIQPAVKDTGRILAFKLVDKGKVVLVLEPLNVKDMGRWISSLFAAIQGIGTATVQPTTTSIIPSAEGAQVTTNRSEVTTNNGGVEPQGMALVTRLEAIPFDTDVIFRQTASVVRSSTGSRSPSFAQSPSPTATSFRAAASLSSPSPSSQSALRSTDDSDGGVSHGDRDDSDNNDENVTINVKYMTRKYEQLATVPSLPETPRSPVSMYKSSSSLELRAEVVKVAGAPPPAHEQEEEQVESEEPKLIVENGGSVTSPIQQSSQQSGSTSLRRTASLGRSDRGHGSGSSSSVGGEGGKRLVVGLRRSASLNPRERVKCWSGPYMAQNDEQVALGRVNPFLAKRRMVRREREIQRLEINVKAEMEKIRRLNKILAETKFTYKELKSMSFEQVNKAQIAQLESDAAVLAQQIRDSERSVTEWRGLIHVHEEEMMSLSKAINWEGHFVVRDRDDEHARTVSSEPEGNSPIASPASVDTRTNGNGNQFSSDDEVSDLEENAPMWAREAQRKSRRAFRILASKGILQ